MTAAAVQDVVAAYVAAWNEPDGDRRRELLARSWADDATYCDPAVLLEGREALFEHARRFAERWPGATIEVTSGIDEHHGFVRFTWRVAGPDGTTLRHGTDFGTVGSHGRLTGIVGFFGSPGPPGPPAPA